MLEKGFKMKKQGEYFILNDLQKKVFKEKLYEQRFNYNVLNLNITYMGLKEPEIAKIINFEGFNILLIPDNNVREPSAKKDARDNLRKLVEDFKLR